MTLSVQITRYESPTLFEALLGAPNGKLRANRLRALADKGLLIETIGLQGAIAGKVTPSPRAASSTAGGTDGGGQDRSAAALGATQLFFGAEEA